MKKWTKKTALQELKNLEKALDGLKESVRGSSEHTSWMIRASAFIEEVFGKKSRYSVMFHAIPWRATGSFFIQAWDLDAAMRGKNHEAYLHSIETARGVLQAAASELQRTELEEVHQGEDSPGQSSTILKVINLAERKLRKTIRSAPSVEKEVQDAFEALLLGADVPYSREAAAIEYSSKTYKPDFTLDQIDLAIDLKLCTRSHREKEIIAEINDDIMAYRTKYGNILFIVYDVGVIRDSDRFSDAFEANENVVVRVVKH